VTAIQIDDLFCPNRKGREEIFRPGRCNKHYCHRNSPELLISAWRAVLRDTLWITEELTAVQPHFLSHVAFDLLQIKRIRFVQQKVCSVLRDPISRDTP